MKLRFDCTGSSVSIGKRSVRAQAYGPSVAVTSSFKTMDPTKMQDQQSSAGRSRPRCFRIF